jgi:hypothetical protein
VRWYLLKNRYEIHGDELVITLLGNPIKETVVSRRHLPKLMTLNVSWCKQWSESDNTYYVVANVRKPDGRRTLITLHRFITECSDNQYVLHLDGDGLNNTDENLLVTDRNRTGAKLKRDLDYGVGFDERRLMWYAVVEVGGQKKTVGYFLSEKEANDAFEQMKLTTDV